VEALVTTLFERGFESRSFQIGEIERLGGHCMCRLSKNLL
jgi:hypothetical protein